MWPVGNLLLHRMSLGMLSPLYLPIWLLPRVCGRSRTSFPGTYAAVIVQSSVGLLPAGVTVGFGSVRLDAGLRGDGRLGTVSRVRLYRWQRTVAGSAGRPGHLDDGRGSIIPRRFDPPKPVLLRIETPRHDLPAFGQNSGRTGRGDPPKRAPGREETPESWVATSSTRSCRRSTERPPASGSASNPGGCNKPAMVISGFPTGTDLAETARLLKNRPQPAAPWSRVRSTSRGTIAPAIRVELEKLGFDPGTIEVSTDELPRRGRRD